MSAIKPVILAGGSGTRLWPLSRTHYPKQFLNLTNEKLSLFQETIYRFNELEHSQPIVICNDEHRFLVAEQLRSIDVNNVEIILEPMPRNTAPAIALAALQAIQNGEDPLLLILAADHAIADNARFISSVNAAVPLAISGMLVTFGIVPTSPHTGYGYICQGDEISCDSFKIHSFTEKPNSMLAEKYVRSGNYLWNSGMFLFKASTFLSELGLMHPLMLESCKHAFQHSIRDMDFIRIRRDLFEATPSDSIDFAVMERTEKGAVVPMTAGWNDIGSWTSLWDISYKDKEGNSLKGDVILFDSENNFISTDSTLVAAVGISNLVIVKTKDAILIADKNKSQDVKKIVEKLTFEKRDLFTTNAVSYRPWGKVEVIEKSDKLIINRITINAKKQIVKQIHQKRSEYWIVVKGVAHIEYNDKQERLIENQSINISPGCKHSLENAGDDPLEIIEIQFGNYLGEDDIIRFEK